MKEYPLIFEELLTSPKPLTADVLKNLFIVKKTTVASRQQAEDRIINRFFYNFLKECEGKS